MTEARHEKSMSVHWYLDVPRVKAYRTTKDVEEMTHDLVPTRFLKVFGQSHQHGSQTRRFPT